LKKKGRRRGRRVEDPHRINQKITADPVRLVGDNVNNEIYSLEEALKIAEEQELDLVEVSDKAVPPVCKVMDYRRFLFEQKKKAKELKAKAAKVDIKEIRFGPNTDEHDINFKVKHAIKFFEEGYKVRAYVFFRGRTIVFKDRGEDLLKRFVEKLEDYAKLEQEPKMEGKKLIIVLAPK
jgi:translation initiation factor IF-3